MLRVREDLEILHTTTVPFSFAGDAGVVGRTSRLCYVYVKIWRLLRTTATLAGDAGVG